LLTVLVALPAFVMSDLSTASLHVSNVVPPFTHRREVPDARLKPILVPTGNFCASGQGEVVVEQRTVAEAVPAPANAIRAAAAMAARPSILTYFIRFSLCSSPIKGDCELRC